MRGLYKGGQSKTVPTHTSVVPSRHSSPFSPATHILQQEEQLLSMENENFLSNELQVSSAIDPISPTSSKNEDIFHYFSSFDKKWI